MEPSLSIPFVVMMAPVLIVFITLRYRYQQTQARYQMLSQLADKGIELPAQLLAEPRVTYSERRRALVLIGAGFGLIAMFLALPGQFDDGPRVSSFWGIGLFPLMIGLGYLASWWLNQREANRG